MSADIHCKTTLSFDCVVTTRWFDGPLATEVFLNARMERSGAAGPQVRVMCSALFEALNGLGGHPENVVAQTLFLRKADFDAKSAHQFQRAAYGDWHRPATTCIVQPPLCETADVEMAVHAIVPREGALHTDLIAVPPNDEYDGVHALRVRLGDEVRLYAGGLHATGSDALTQTRNIFEAANRLLTEVGMTFHNVARTWFYLRDINRDYPALNRARREFFADHDVTLAPASTGIGGAPVDAAHLLCTGFYAVRASTGVPRSEMTSPTLNSASDYGADFVRGLALNEANRKVLFVSGTASVNERGETTHVGDMTGQVERMLVNLKALLAEQGATFRDVVSAVTYLKHPHDRTRLVEAFAAHRFERFPNTIVHAPVCRDDLLCETETGRAFAGRRCERLSRFHDASCDAGRHTHQRRLSDRNARDPRSHAHARLAGSARTGHAEGHRPLPWHHTGGAQPHSTTPVASLRLAFTPRRASIRRVDPKCAAVRERGVPAGSEGRHRARRRCGRRARMRFWPDREAPGPACRGPAPPEASSAPRRPS